MEMNDLNNKGFKFTIHDFLFLSNDQFDDINQDLYQDIYDTTHLMKMLLVKSNYEFLSCVQEYFDSLHLRQ